MCAGLEVASLATRRLRAYADVPSTVAMCKNPGELLSAQMRFWRQAAQDYADCNRRIAEAWTSTSDRSSVAEDASVRPRDYITFREPAGDPARPPSEDAAASRRRAA